MRNKNQLEIKLTPTPMLKKILLIYLRFLSKKIITKHKPKIFGVTGTTGKSSTTTFLSDLLEKIYPGKVSKNNGYNGEIGLPLNILQSKSPKKNIFKWIGLFFQMRKLLRDPNYPQYLILEYGIDRPGEMQYLMTIAKPFIGIILNITPNHIKNFQSFKQYRDEKLHFALHTQYLIFNGDDPQLEPLKEKSKHPRLSYGFKKDNKYTLTQIPETPQEYQLHYLTQNHILTNPFLEPYQINNILPVYITGTLLGNTPEIVIKNLQHPPILPGRGTILHTIQNSTTYDHSYNAGYQSMTAGIEFFIQLPIPETEKIIILGDMRELGQYEQQFHENIAKKLNHTNFHHYYLIGDIMRKYSYPKLTKTQKTHLQSSQQLGEILRKTLEISPEKKYHIYIKGSQNTIFLEESIIPILNNPNDQQLLCRQSPQWKKIKKQYFETLQTEKKL